MTPNDIEVLIHCHCIDSPHPRLSAPAVQNALADFEQRGLICQGIRANTYMTTAGGSLFIEMLCNTPFPTQKWIDPRDKS